MGRILQQVEGLSKDCLNQRQGGRLMVCVNVLEQLWIDGADDFVKETAHARIGVEPLLLNPQSRTHCRQCFH
jgi:hypothetical protein